MQISPKSIFTTIVIFVSAALIYYQSKNIIDNVDTLYCADIKSRTNWTSIQPNLPSDFIETNRLLEEGKLVIFGYLEGDLLNGTPNLVVSTFYEVEVSMNTLKYTLSEEEVNLEFIKPCENCQIQVTYFSPNMDSAIAEIISDKSGLWLLNDKKKIQLMDFIPNEYRVLWSNDNEIVWVEFTFPDVGISYIVATNMADDVNVLSKANLESNYSFELTNNLYTEYEFDPSKNNIWVFERFSDQPSIFDLNSETVRNVTIDQFIKSEWHPELNSLMIVTYNGDDVMMQFEDGSASIVIPKKVTEMVFGPFWSENILISNILGRKSYFSPDLRELIIESNGIIYHIECEP